MVLNVLLVGDQHLDLQLPELLPEGELGLPLGDELVGHHLLLNRPLVLVVLGVPVLLNVPHGVRLLDVPVGGHLELHETPLRVVFPGEPQSGACVHMNEPNLAVDRVPNLAGRLSVDDVHLDDDDDDEDNDDDDDDDGDDDDDDDDDSV